MIEILTPKQAAEYLGIAQSTLIAWADAGIIPCIRTAGNHRRYRIADLRQHLAERRQRLGLVADPVEHTIQQMEHLLDELRGILANDSQ